MTWEQLAVIPVLSFLLLVHELGHFVVARLVGIRVEEFGFGLPPRLWGFRRGEVIYSINAIPLGAFVRMTGENGENAGDARSFSAKGKLARAAVLVAGPGMNFLAAAVLFAFAFMIGTPTATVQDTFVYSVSNGSPAEAAGIRAGDKVVAVDGAKVTTVSQFVDATRQRIGQPLNITIERDGQQIDEQVIPRTKWPEGEGPLGVGLQGKAVKTELVRYPVYRAVPMGFGEAWQSVQSTFQVIAMVIRGAIPAEVARPTGPIGIYRMTTDAAEQIADNGWWYPLIALTAFVSTGLALANILPFPALDGGRLLMIGVEAVRRKKVSPEREGALHFVGLMVLLTLMIVVSYYDVITPVPSIDWGLR
ncbi:MAG TPA: M50 family metallopeptidase [Chloroflexota bacterium]